MTTRWWAPTGAHLGPDINDLILLETGGEPRYDLGAALFALHRTGAAACETVAATPIPDAHTLIGALAATREMFAPLMVDSVAKSVNAGPVYAGLLVRDVIDDAEEGALHVFTTATGKGVPGGVAATRAGLVYGVSKQDLGGFLSLASELKAHPAALADAADRALFSYVERLVTEEADDTVVVSKATPMLMADEPRDAGGRWTRGGPTVGTLPADTLAELRARFQADQAERETELPPEKPKPVVRTKRKTRTRRRTSSAATEAARPPAQRKLRASLKAAIKPLLRHKLSANPDDYTPAGDDEPHGSLTGSSLPKFPRNETSWPMLPGPKTLGFVMTDDSYRSLVGEMVSSSAGERQFLMGSLTERAHPERYGNDAHLKKANDTAAIAGERARADVFDAPHTRVVYDKDLPGYSAMTNDAPVDETKRVLAIERVKLVHEVLEAYLPDAVEFKNLLDTEVRTATTVRRLPDDTGIAIIYTPTNPQNDANPDPAMVTAYGKLNELVVVDSDVRGRVQPTTSKIVLDPNQAYKLRDYVQEVYDPVNHVMITRHFVQAIPDDTIGKAAGYLTETRDTEGRWTASSYASTGHLEPVQSVTHIATPVARTRRKTRTKRRSRAAEAPAASTAAAAHRPLVGMQLTPLQKHLVRAAAQPGPKPADLPGKLVLSKNGMFTVLSPSQMAGLISLAGVTDTAMATGYVPLDTEEVQDAVFGAQSTAGTRLADLIYELTDSEVMHNEMGVSVPVAEVNITEADGWSMVGNMMRRYLDAHPHASQVSITPSPNDPDEVMLHANEHRISPLAILVHDPQHHPADAPGLNLIKEGRWSEIAKDFTDMPDPGLGLVDPPVEIWRYTPPVRPR